MSIAHLKLVVGMAFAVAPVLQPLFQGELYAEEDPLPLLAPEDFDRHFAAIKPYPGEWRWREDIPWAGTIHEARARAAKEDKPILAWQSANSPPLGST